jgi:phospholipid/cholesterol/gamma-HCH transport system substrate-binding protein
MKNSVVETIVGAGVIAIAAVFFVFAYTTSGIGKGAGGYNLSAEFENVEGINIGSDVRLAGIKIGSVTKQELDPQSYQARIVMSISDEVKLPDDSTAKVTSEGLLGGKFVAIEPGGSEELLKDGDQMSYTQGAIDLWALINQFMFESGKKNEK